MRILDKIGKCKNVTKRTRLWAILGGGVCVGAATFIAFAQGEKTRTWTNANGETICRGTLDVERTLDEGPGEGAPNKVYFREANGDEVEYRYRWLSEADRKRVIDALNAPPCPQKRTSRNASPSPQKSSGKEPEAGTLKTLKIDGMTYNFRYCPAGEFTMGVNASAHQVKLTRGFWTMETEVTQAMWEKTMGWNHSCQSERGECSDVVRNLVTSDFPVENITWNHCQEFIRRLNASAELPAGLKLRLPTEAEWEYACRAGTYSDYAGARGDLMAWSVENADPNDWVGMYPRTHKVATKMANPWGLRDMHGNVWEWCADWYEEDYHDGTLQTDPTGPSSGKNRVIRGGSFRDWFPTAAERSYAPATSASGVLGARLVLAPEAD